MLRLTARFAGFVALSLVTMLMWCALRWGWADWLSRQRTLSDIRRATQLAPRNWELYQDWSEIAQKDAIWALRRALAGNPLNSGLHLDLATYEEKAGDFAVAEAEMKRAVELDRTSGPRAALAEYYFRRKEPEKFWITAREALQMAANPDEELFKDGWLLSSDAELIQRQLIPERTQVLQPYLQFLLEQNRLDAAAPVAALVMAKPCCEPSVKNLFSDYVERLAAANRVDESIGAWNWMADKGLIPFPKLGTERKAWVMNAGFEVAPTEASSGFSWQTASSEGVFVDYLAKEHALKFSFTGKEAEHCELLAEDVALWPGRKYSLRVKFQMSDIPPESGLHWRVVMPPNQDLLANGALTGNAADIGPVDKEQTFTFAGPAQPAIARLILAYDRAIGTVRVEGTMELRRVDGWVE